MTTHTIQYADIVRDLLAEEEGALKRAREAVQFHTSPEPGEPAPMAETRAILKARYEEAVTIHRLRVQMLSELLAYAAPEPPLRPRPTLATVNGERV